MLVIDMFNDYNHEDGKQLAANVAKIIDPLVGLVHNGERRNDVDLIYVNDNHGDFTADHSAIFATALDGERPDLVKPLKPPDGSHILTKVRHSAFYSTSLDYLLVRLKAKRIVLTGQVTEQCILYTALDGYIRHYDVIVPPDAVAHIDEELGAAALKLMERNMSAQLLPAARCLA